MELPNPNVVKAIFESYINIRRRTDWKKIDDKNFEMPSGTPGIKLTAITELLLKIENARTPDDWFKIVYALDERERIEDKEQTGKKYYPLGKIYTTFTGKKPGLLHTTHAAVTYILSHLVHDVAFENTKRALNHEIRELTAKKHDCERFGGKIAEIETKLNEAEMHLAVLNADSVYYHTSYFEEFTLVEEIAHSDELKKLNEKSFADFEKNVRTRSRKLNNCNMLLEYARKHPEKFSGAVAQPKPAEPVTVQQKVEVKAQPVRETKPVAAKVEPSFATFTPRQTATPQFTSSLFTNANKWANNPLTSKTATREEEDTHRLRDGKTFK